MFRASGVVTCSVLAAAAAAMALRERFEPVALFLRIGWKRLLGG
jgi:hypothetical protein